MSPSGAEEPILPSARTVVLEGSGFDRGVTHGESLRPLIADVLDRWRANLAERHRVAPHDFVRQFLAGTGHRNRVEDLCPDLAAEVRGIATGATQDVDEIWAYNFMDEEWWFQPTAAEVGCSVVATPVTSSAGRATLLAQNMDLPAWMDGSQAVLQIREGEAPDQIVATAAGMIGLIGANSAGLGLCVNTLLQLDRSADGLPVAFVVREVLRRGTVTEAAAFLSTVPHASGQHYVLADGAHVRAFECSARGCVEGPASDELLHTNHPLWSSHLRDPQPTDRESEARAANSAARLAALRTGMPGVRSSRTARELLAHTDSGLCMVPSPEAPTTTFLSVEYVLTAPPQVHVTMGRPDTAPWEPVSWATALAS
jgi:predicted choloylglycine hydrolase